MGLSLVGQEIGDFHNINSINNIFGMGNLCNVIANEKKKASAPHSLSDLLGTVNLSINELLAPVSLQNDDTKFQALERELNNNVWISRFRDFLVSRNLEDEEIALHFLVMTQPLQAMMNKKKTFGATESDRRRLFKLVSDRFFSAESPGVLALNNTVLFNDLTATRASIQADLKVSEESLVELLQARVDPLVWDEGLEPIYFKFAQQAGVNQVACLLSLL